MLCGHVKENMQQHFYGCLILTLSPLYAYVHYIYMYVYVCVYNWRSGWRWLVSIGCLRSIAARSISLHIFGHMTKYNKNVSFFNFFVVYWFLLLHIIIISCPFFFCLMVVGNSLYEHIYNFNIPMVSKCGNRYIAY